jgi:hypothetical protein
MNLKLTLSLNKAFNLNKITLLFFLFIGLNTTLRAQENHPHIEPLPAEEYYFRIHYGFFNAVYAKLSRSEEVFEGKKVNHVVGSGATTGVARLFMRVDDRYESYYTNDFKPYYFKRSVREGNYEKDEEIRFDYQTEKAIVTNLTSLERTTIPIVDELQDLMSYYFYLKETINPKLLKVNDVITVPIVFDADGIFYFKVKYLGEDQINTDFGEKVCYLFQPYIDFGSRVFGENKNFKVWISKDELLPIKVKAPLVIGSIVVDLEEYYPSK